MVNLNCYEPATSSSPGFSAGSNHKDAQAVRETHAEETRAWKQSEEGQEWCAKAEVDHPGWGPIEGC